MKISVIIPVYNVAPFLRQCLDSVINQTYKDLQIIVVDDGSTDESGAICDEYATKDKRVSVYHHENKNVAAVLNFGLSVAEGQLIAQVDSDDMLHPQMYELLYKALVENNADLSGCKWTNSQSHLAQVNVSNPNYIFLDAKKDYALFHSELNCFRWNKLYKKELFKDFTYNEGHVFEDEYGHRIAYQCPKTVVVDLPLYFYRLRNGSFMHTFSEKRAYDSFIAFDDRVAFALEKKWTESYSFIFPYYCKRAMWVWKTLKEFNVANKKVRAFCRQKVRDFVATHHQVSLPRKCRLWSKNLFLYYAYVIFTFLFFWEKSDKKLLRKRVDFLLSLGLVPKVKNKKEDLVCVLATDGAWFNEDHYVLYSLFRQTHKADKIVLYIPQDELSLEDVQHNKKMCKFIKKGLTVKLYNQRQVGSERNFKPAHDDFPHSKIIVCNEKAFYHKKWLENELEKSNG